jgi:hypothetical protein
VSTPAAARVPCTGPSLRQAATRSPIAEGKPG